MTDRHIAYVVTLDKEVRADDAEKIIAALYCLTGVVRVDPVLADWSTAMIVQNRRDLVWIEKLRDLIRDMQ